jgi:hypothetical protein
MSYIITSLDKVVDVVNFYSGYWIVPIFDMDVDTNTETEPETETAHGRGHRKWVKVYVLSWNYVSDDIVIKNFRVIRHLVIN